MNKVILVALNATLMLKINSGCCGNKTKTTTKTQSKKTLGKDFNKENLKQDLGPFFNFYLGCGIKNLVEDIIKNYHVKNFGKSYDTGDMAVVSFKNDKNSFFIVIENNKYRIVTDENQTKIKNAIVLEFICENTPRRSLIIKTNK